MAITAKAYLEQQCECLILHFTGSTQRQGPEPASWSRGSVSPWSITPALRGSVFHSGLLNCAHKHEGGKPVCCQILSTGK